MFLYENGLPDHSFPNDIQDESFGIGATDPITTLLRSRHHLLLKELNGARAFCLHIFLNFCKLGRRAYVVNPDVFTISQMMLQILRMFYL